MLNVTSNNAENRDDNCDVINRNSPESQTLKLSNFGHTYIDRVCRHKPL